MAALAAAEAASNIVRLQWWDSAATAPEMKAAGDYVTAVDRAAEAAALEVLDRMAPGIPVLAEEGGGRRADLVWVVDPVDGTTNLVRGFPVVGVSVALLEGDEPIVAAVAAPRLGETWSAIAAGGARDGGGTPLRVSARPPSQAVVATGFPFRRKAERIDRYLRAFDAALRSFEDLRRPGAASLDLAYTAAGTWDGFFELGLSVWDIAAGALLVREAGGVVTDWEGDETALFRSGNILAGSPQWHQAMLGLLRTALAT